MKGFCTLEGEWGAEMMEQRWQQRAGLRGSRTTDRDRRVFRKEHTMQAGSRVKWWGALALVLMARAFAAGETSATSSTFHFPWDPTAQATETLPVEVPPRKGTKKS